MDEMRRSLSALYEAKDLIADGLHKLADLAANPRLDDDARRQVAEAVHRLADAIEELD